MKAMVLYCSKTGNTEKIAKRTARELGCPILKVEPDIVYGGFLSSCARVIGDRMKKETPGFVTEIPDISAYDTILAGYPVWAGGVPDYMAEFLKALDLAGKRVIPFATSALTETMATIPSLSAACPGAKIDHPFYYGVKRKDNYRAWLASLEEKEEEESEVNEENAVNEESAVNEENEVKGETCD